VTAYGGKGSALRLDPLIIRFGRQLRPGPRGGTSALNGRIVELRELLRTDKSIREIAEELGMDAQAVRRFVKQRQICNLKDRSNFITLQKSLKRLEALGEKETA
jgi:hypothetical protein